MPSQVHTHRVVVAEGLAAARALARTVDESVLDAFVAENVAACLNDAVLEGGFTN